MMNIILQDCISMVSHNQIRKNIHGLILRYSEKFTALVKNHNHSFIREKARKIIPKLKKNLLTATSLGQRDRNVIHSAHRKIRGNAIFATSKLNQIAHNNDAVIHVPTLDQSMTANADERESIHVHTKARTSTETTLELSNIVVIRIQLQKAFGTDDVNFFSKFLNHPLVMDETDCSK